MPFQANTFANWVNVNLDEINSECKRVGKTGQQTTIEEDFRDGTILCALVEKLQKRRIRLEQPPTTIPDLLECDLMQQCSP